MLGCLMVGGVRGQLGKKKKKKTTKDEYFRRLNEMCCLLFLVLRYLLPYILI